MKIRDSVAFVTGANRGIGLAFAQELLAGGARKVYAAARQPERISMAGVEPVRLDVTNPEDVAAVARQCTDVNLLINNAGIALWSGFLAPNSVEAARSEMETNYYGPLMLSRAFAPVLAKNGGGITLNQAKTSIKLAQAWPLIQIPAVGRDIEGARCSLGRYGT